MIICLCHRVSDRDIRTAVQSGTLSFDLLQDETGVSFLPKPLDIKTLAERVKQELHAA